jgi:hypothetical protein
MTELNSVLPVDRKGRIRYWQSTVLAGSETLQMPATSSLIYLVISFGRVMTTGRLGFIAPLRDLFYEALL